MQTWSRASRLPDPGPAAARFRCGVFTVVAAQCLNLPVRCAFSHVQVTRHSTPSELAIKILIYFAMARTSPTHWYVPHPITISQVSILTIHQGWCNILLGRLNPTPNHDHLRPRHR